LLSAAICFFGTLPSSIDALGFDPPRCGRLYSPRSQRAPSNRGAQPLRQNNGPPSVASFDPRRLHEKTTDSPEGSLTSRAISAMGSPRNFLFISRHLLSGACDLLLCALTTLFVRSLMPSEHGTRVRLFVSSDAADMFFSLRYSGVSCILFQSYVE
jgi:hypothetical protein